MSNCSFNLGQGSALWSLNSQHSHSHKLTVLSPYQNTCQAFCSSYCFVIYYSTRKHLAWGVVPFSRRNKMKEQKSKTQKANQTHTEQSKQKTTNPKPPKV